MSLDDVEFVQCPILTARLLIVSRETVSKAQLLVIEVELEGIVEIVVQV